jgi:hypothetical protein
MGARAWIHVFSIVAACSSAGWAPAEVILVRSDLQMSGSPSGQFTQPGWVAQNVIKTSGTGSLSLTPTASGSAAGVTATLVTGGSWESRGGSAEGRDLVAGTSFNFVVSDLWVTRTMSFAVALNGLSAGSTYLMRTWHNDSYNLNQGFAAGGGSVQISAMGATVVSTTNGSVTNLRGTQTDAAFGIAAITFVPSVGNPQIGLTRVGGSITALPVNGVEVTLITVPEPDAFGEAMVSGMVFLAAAAGVRRRHHSNAGCRRERCLAAIARR